TAENLDDPPGGRTRRRRPPRELDHHHLAGCGVPGISGDHLNIGQDPAIERHHVAHARVVGFVAADQGAVATLEDADDAAFGTIAALVLHTGDNAIAVQGLLD